VIFRARTSFPFFFKRFFQLLSFLIVRAGVRSPHTTSTISSSLALDSEGSFFLLPFFSFPYSHLPNLLPLRPFLRSCSRRKKGHLPITEAGPLLFQKLLTSPCLTLREAEREVRFNTRGPNSVFTEYTLFGILSILIILSCCLDR